MKEEIKAFLNNRRISQAIVGQVTGKHLGPRPSLQASSRLLVATRKRMCVCVVFFFGLFCLLTCYANAPRRH